MNRYAFFFFFFFFFFFVCFFFFFFFFFFLFCCMSLYAYVSVCVSLGNTGNYLLLVLVKEGRTRLVCWAERPLLPLIRKRTTSQKRLEHGITFVNIITNAS